MAKKYLEFVRRIADPGFLLGTSLEKCKQAAEQAGYRYLTFNGGIYYLAPNKEWILLDGLKLSDFEI